MIRTVRTARLQSAGDAALRSQGFSLIELMVVLLIIAILAAIAYPSYISHVTKTHRVAAEACLSEYANYMQRFYTTSMRFDKDNAGNANTLPVLDCASSQNTGADYKYSFASLTRSTFKINAAPQGVQAHRDTQCGTLSLDQGGQRGVGGTGGVTNCW